MNNVLDMQDLRYLRLFNKVTKVNTRFCFEYNNNLLFFVPKNMIKKALGEERKNLNYLNNTIKKRVKIFPMPKGIEDAKGFIEALVNPIQFKGLEINENEIILSAGMQSKASIIGRNKKKLMEMQKIIKGFFGRDFKVA